MFTHLTIGSNDRQRARIFYDALFATMGGAPAQVMPNGNLVYRHDGSTLLVVKPANGEPATHANGGTIGLRMDSPEMVHAWQDAGVAHGGTAIEDPAGMRDGKAFGQFYVAYLRDPDGNKLCGLYRPAAA